MKTIKERIEAKAAIIERKRKSDIEYISVFSDDDRESPNFGRLEIEFKTWKGPKIVNGNLCDYDDTFAIAEMRNFLKPLGLDIEIESNDNGCDLFFVYFQ